MDFPSVNYHLPLQSFHDVGSASELEKTVSDPEKKSVAERQSSLESFTDSGESFHKDHAVLADVLRKIAEDAFDHSDANSDDELTEKEKSLFFAFLAQNLQTLIDQVRAQLNGESQRGISLLEGKLASISSLSTQEQGKLSGLLELIKGAISSRSYEGFPGNRDDLVNELFILALAIMVQQPVEPEAQQELKVEYSDDPLYYNPLAEEIAIKGET